MKSDQDKVKGNAASQGGIVDLASYRRKKEVDEELARGRKPLYVSHLTGKVTGAPRSQRSESQDFGDRLQRIRASLEKINRLMGELKKMSATDEALDQRAKPQTKS